MNKKYRATLTPAEREELGGLLARGKADVRRLKHAQILLKADQAGDGPAWPDHTPKHGSWLNMAEVELSALARQRLSRRIARPDTLKRHVQHWGERRNAAGGSPERHAVANEPHYIEARA